MRLVPIPSDQLTSSAPYWLPFVESVAKRQRCFVQQRLDDITSGKVALVLVWDDDARAAKALIGLSFMQRGSDKIARIVWTAGKDRHQWINLLPELEQMCRDSGFMGMDTIARRGWYKELKRFGYRLTHVQLEKDF